MKFIKYSLLLVFIILVITLFIIIFLKPQHITVFDYDTFPYTCNTFIEIDIQNRYTFNMNILKKHIIKKIDDIPLLRDNLVNLDVQFSTGNIDDINDIISNTKLFKLKWKLTIIKITSDKLLILFQNHRSLCGGNERLNDIINNLVDNKETITYNVNKNIDVKSLKNIIKYNIISNFLRCYNSDKLNYSSYYYTLYMKNYQLNFIRHKCKLLKCTINDYFITKCAMMLVNNRKIIESHINIFVPLYVNKQYSYYILRIPNIKSTFYRLLTYITNLTNNSIKEYTIRESSIKTYTLINKFLPKKLNVNIYKKMFSKIHLFISNIHGFKHNKSVLSNNITNIFHSYRSYECLIECGISSFRNNINCTYHVNTEFITTDISTISDYLQN